MIKFKTEEGVKLPEYKSEGAVGFDVVSHSILKVFKGDEEIVGEKLEKIKKTFAERGYIKIRPFQRVLFSTGLTVADLSNDIELQVRSRSGIALKRGLFVVNQPGTIDPDYRAIIGITMYNSTPFLNKIEKNERIAQIVPKQIIKPTIKLSEYITNTQRGSNGFGSSGKF